MYGSWTMDPTENRLSYVRNPVQSLDDLLVSVLQNCPSGPFRGLLYSRLRILPETLELGEWSTGTRRVQERCPEPRPEEVPSTVRGQCVVTTRGPLVPGPTRKEPPLPP